MLPSVRRVASTAAGPGSGLTSALASSVLPKATSAASVPFLRRGHQRRASSSKPSRSDNGASDLPDQSVPASASSARGQGKAGGDKRKRKASDRNAAMKKLPSVPNTHHMVGEALGLSSFFSLHRPISITQTMPKTITDEQFASIFAPRTKANRMTDAMSTLSTTIDQIEGPMASLTVDGGHHDHHHHGDGMSRLEVKHHDGSESSIYLQVDAMSGDFLPFRPPPIPQPQTQTTANLAGESDEAIADMDAAAVADEAPHHRVYKAMFTIEESMEADGQIRIIAHTPQILQNEQQSVQQVQQPRSFVERLAQRQLKLDETRGRRDLYAISVRRQRKLRMKKKKYKKLMRRTRNERRKLDRN